MQIFNLVNSIILISFIKSLLIIRKISNGLQSYVAVSERILSHGFINSPSKNNFTTIPLTNSQY